MKNGGEGMDRNGKLRVLEILTREGQEGIAQEIWPEAKIVQAVLDLGWLNDPGGVGHYDMILASHVLQAVDGANVTRMVRVWASWLREGGELHLVLPDLMWACEQVVKGGEVDRYTLEVIYGQTGAEHRSGFTVGLVRGVLAAAGLKVKAARLGPYGIVGMDAEGKEHEVIARQVYVVGVNGVNGWGNG